MSREVVAARARAEAEAGGRRSAFGMLLRWAKAARVRCESGHVTRHGTRPAHLEAGVFCRRSGCGSPAYLTFPEDKDGPCVPPAPYSTHESGITTR
jgi:hypothetical protein